MDGEKLGSLSKSLSQAGNETVLDDEAKRTLIAPVFQFNSIPPLTSRVILDSLELVEAGDGRHRVQPRRRPAAHGLLNGRSRAFIKQSLRKSNQIIT